MRRLTFCTAIAVLLGILAFACSRPVTPAPTAIPTAAAIAKVNTLTAALIAHDPTIEPSLLTHLHPMNCDPSCYNEPPPQGPDCAECENPTQYLYTTYSWTIQNSCGAEGDPCYWGGKYYDDGWQYWVIGNCGYMYDPN